MHNIKTARLSVDPGLAGTGYAIWNGDKAAWETCEAPLLAAELKARKGQWEFRARALAEAFRKLIVESPYRITDCYCEFPQFFTSAKGYVAAQSDSLEKLTFLVGYYAGVCMEQAVHFHPIKVHAWKGQLRKEAVIHRIVKRLGEANCIDWQGLEHAWDAIGIGLYAKGAFIK